RRVPQESIVDSALQLLHRRAAQGLEQAHHLAVLRLRVAARRSELLLRLDGQAAQTRSRVSHFRPSRSARKTTPSECTKSDFLMIFLPLGHRAVEICVIS